MTDWDLVVEQIQNAMQAVDQAHEASEKLRNHVTLRHLMNSRHTCKNYVSI